MTKHRRPLAIIFAFGLLFGAAACGDDAGEDEIGDNEIIDEGD